MQIENKGVEQGGEAPTPPVETPSTEETQVASQEAPAPQAGTDEAPQQNVESEEELPQDSEKAKEAFITMRRRIKELESTQQAVSQEGSMLENLRGNYPQLPDDEISPDIEAEELVRRASEAEKRSYQAQQQVEQLQRQHEDNVLYTELPQLNSAHPDFNKPETKILKDLVEGQYLVKKLSANGRPFNMEAFVRDIKRNYQSLVQGTEAQATQRVQEQLSKKEQATLDPRGGSPKIPTTNRDNVEDSRARARRGNMDAMADVLKNTVLSEQEFGE